MTSSERYYLPLLVGNTSHRQKEEEVGMDIREWTGLEFAKSQGAVENKENWREKKKKKTQLVAKSSVVPQRPPRLRDR